MRANRTIRFFSAHIRKLPHLSVKEKKVLVKRLRRITLEKIGKKYGVTEGRIRQIEKKALQKVKSKYYQQRLFQR
ncbi:hypothetical protein A3A76_02020 [Candidatus Woesebacteria bacterium RIFCSPLOWO2_01_FULL_39_23]|uniref:RNA polymerase sigma-70 region 4 domain-containing protein n=1 Tax=Candidatus Woesebacteria bacterium RIFCSPHIGHO2_01_FULL_40_22 TaxID=1802499 RepID=A0A1F7YI42_9BACT|nr:MAG: hypothetical protein A2141_03165 [Candidatus Woesebacteria bacterium RBG_16_40_11]OGM26175.1 MAG: hypothetical protein A2628_02450 [Candidatus Woesebacteria bacterium RIFCSPHIGHO2_01_FULL_40_22]OGM37962.1 MAG: hypothetical protein A3E41_03530 [Candidatus Woesebacteria bacterium RIFCSPHIGHO2_12_FULL_38_9]OGM62334.1 MAG: hypothetical protein A3A76_02020 [Candidatus Woesebacteria bacterium RIFCSPLOWO2_01_FULL_39_23]